MCTKLKVSDLCPVLLLQMWDLYQRHLIDTKVDIWALGVLLFVLCYGRLPFTGDSKLQVINAKYEMPQTRAPQVRQGDRGRGG